MLMTAAEAWAFEAMVCEVRIVAFFAEHHGIYRVACVRSLLVMCLF